MEGEYIPIIREFSRALKFHFNKIILEVLCNADFENEFWKNEEQQKNDQRKQLFKIKMMKILN